MTDTQNVANETAFSDLTSVLIKQRNDMTIALLNSEQGAMLQQLRAQRQIASLKAEILSLEQQLAERAKTAAPKTPRAKANGKAQATA